MSISNDCTDDIMPRLKMKPAVNRICCCSVTAASGFIAAYALVAYAIALIYEIVWIIEAQSGLPVASVMLMVCYCIVITATVTLVHGLMAKENKYLLAWLIAVILVLIPECALVFYMSISHWGLQGVYGGAELACYVARLPAIVCGVVLVQSAYAIREARNQALKKTGFNGQAVSGSEFDASHYVPEASTAFSNDAFIPDTGKTGSMPDLRRHLAAQAPVNYGYPPMMVQPPPAYWQHLAERQYAASLRGYPKPYHLPANQYGTWVGPRQTPYDTGYKRRHSVIGAFSEEYEKDYGEFYPQDRTDCKSEFNYPAYRYPCYDRGYDPRMYGHEYDPRYYDMKRPDDAAYGVNLLRQDSYFGPSRDRVFYGPGLRNSHQSVANESDDLTKYKDVAL